MNLSVLKYIVLLFVLSPLFGFSQKDTTMLLTNRGIQLEITDALDSLYNFNFKHANREFEWLKYRYPNHPLPYFLLSLSTWWQIAPNIEIEAYDDYFCHNLDSSIELANEMLKNDEESVEAAYFLTASYAFKARLLSERHNWSKAAYYTRKSLKYLNYKKEKHDLSPEFLFGDGLYNYYSIWIPENYTGLKFVLAFFEKGNKEQGIDQLEVVSSNAFYSRIEAQIFLMKILAMEGQAFEAASVATYLYKHYPQNPYFKRIYARSLYSTGKYRQCLKVSQEILNDVEDSVFGYEVNSGKYASFFLGQVSEAYGKQQEAKFFYQRAIDYSMKLERYKTGYYFYSMLYLAQIYIEEDNISMAKDILAKLKKESKREMDEVYEKAKFLLKKI